MSAFVIDIVPADGLALIGDGAFGVTVMSSFLGSAYVWDWNFKC